MRCWPLTKDEEDVDVDKGYEVDIINEVSHQTQPNYYYSRLLLLILLLLLLYIK